MFKSDTLLLVYSMLSTMFNMILLILISGFVIFYFFKNGAKKKNISNGYIYIKKTGGVYFIINIINHIILILIPSDKLIGLLPSEYNTREFLSYFFLSFVFQMIILIGMLMAVIIRVLTGNPLQLEIKDRGFTFMLASISFYAIMFMHYIGSFFTITYKEFMLLGVVFIGLIFVSYVVYTVLIQVFKRMTITKGFLIGLFGAIIYILILENKFNYNSAIGIASFIGSVVGLIFWPTIISMLITYFSNDKTFQNNFGSTLASVCITFYIIVGSLIFFNS